MKQPLITVCLSAVESPVPSEDHQKNLLINQSSLIKFIIETILKILAVFQMGSQGRLLIGLGPGLGECEAVLLARDLVGFGRIYDITALDC